MLSIVIKSLTIALVAGTTFAAPTAYLDLEARQSACPDVAVFFARGTTEIPTLGAIVGPPLSAALRRALPNKSIEFNGVNYPAAITGFLVGGDEGGSITMANSVTSIANRCRDIKIVMSGYSQGAQVTHKAANKLSSAIQQRVVAVLTFGDPKERTALPGVLQSRRKTFCSFGDLICRGMAIVLAPHLGYGSDASAAAAFVAARV